MKAGQVHPAAMGLREWALLLTLSVLWGGSFFLGKVALAELPPLTLVLGRTGFAAAALWPVVLAAGHGVPRKIGVWRAFFVMGLLNNLIPFGLIFWGQTRIASGLASILNATTPLFTIVVAHLLTRDERMTGDKLGGVLLGFAGVAVMVGPDALFGGFGAGVAGQAAVLGAALSYGFASVYGRRFRAMGLPPLVTAAGQITATTAMVVPLALLVDRPWSFAAPPQAATWGAVLGLALLCTALGYALYFRILAVAGATNIALVTFLIPASAILLGATILGERLAVRHFAGLALIGLGLAAIDGRLPAALRRRSRRRSEPPPVVPPAG
ncbi:MAG TPA: DMT family transporter [Stellaceae bacterium]